MESPSGSILITGGLGYIGSHTSTIFLEEGFEVIIVDNLSNSDISVLDKIKEITGIKPVFYNIDIRDISAFDKVFKNHLNIEGVIHFSAKKAVGESCQDPFLYYENNILGTLNLLKLMQQYNKKNIVFSSSATVYDVPKLLPPFSENDRVGSYSPYGTTKLVMEYMLKDLANFKGFNVINLRYFNPIGAHFTGLIGEDPRGVPSNLLPYVFKVAKGEIEYVQIFGDDYDTADGTGVRDYVHVMDVAEAHLSAYNQVLKYNEYKIEYDIDPSKGYFDVFNIGTGDGKSVKEIIELVEKITEKEIAYKIVSRRAGDVDTSIANPQKAKQVLGREYNRSIYQAIEDARRFVQLQK